VPRNPRTIAGLEARGVAAARLAAVLKGAPFAPLTEAELPDGRDRALANRLVTTALRRHGHLNVAIARYLDRGLPKGTGAGPFEAVLRLALGELVYLPEAADHSAIFLAVEAMKADSRTRHLGKLVNAVLRRAQAEAEMLRALPPELLFPEALREAWTNAYGAEAVGQFAVALLAGAPLDLTLRDDDPGLLAALGAVPLIGDTVRLADRDRRIEELPGYGEGRWWVQDAAAAIPARLLNLTRGANVLDLCAAPGGKTAQLIKAGYAVTALDRDEQRLGRLRSNLGRLGMAAEIVLGDAAEWRPERSFSGVLLDAPCSSTGTFRRHPEVAWHRRDADIAGRAALQRRLLGHAADCLEQGGILIYCVCSLEPEEGERQAEWARAELPQLEPLPIEAGEIAGLAEALRPDGTVRTHPGLRVGATVAGDNGTLDGFFVARFRRR
jgi:16S rRNA (cytosine967-C5)-methyltransferase